MRKMTRLLAALLVLTLLICSCSGEEKRKVEIVPNVVWVYDVEPQDLSHIKKGTYDKYLEALENPADPASQKLVAGFEAVEFKTHEYRQGIFTGLATGGDAPFLGVLSRMEREGEISIEYFVMDSWEEVRADIELNKDNGITKIVLFNNSYDESIYKEVTSGQYAELDGYMEDMGLYDEAAYDQAVMSAGFIDGEQYLVPILYNVSGMIQGKLPEYDEMGQIVREGLTKEDYARESLSFEAFLEKLMAAMKENDPASDRFTYISPGFYENDPDLYLLASGLQWEEYDQQEDLFALMLEYYNTYQEYQASEHDGLSDQSLMIMYQEAFERASYGDPGYDKVLDDLGIEPLEYEGGLFDTSSADFSFELKMRTEYWAESSTSEEIPFHSIAGLLAFSGFWTFGDSPEGQTVDKEFGSMEYWPVAMMGEEAAFAAQPICYAAVVDDGDTEMAMKVITQLLGEEVKAKYGFSPCLATREAQLESWDTEGGFNDLKFVRDIEYDGANKTYDDTKVDASWGQGIGANGGRFAHQVASEQLREQLSAVTTAQIPDREAVAIWQDTLAEASEQGLSAETGFELLCERMDTWYEE